MTTFAWPRAGRRALLPQRLPDREQRRLLAHQAGHAQLARPEERLASRSMTCGMQPSTARACSSAPRTRTSSRTACPTRSTRLKKRVGAGAAAATSNLQPVAGDNLAFTAQYQTADWVGDVKARTIDLSTGAMSYVELVRAVAAQRARAYRPHDLHVRRLGPVRLHQHGSRRQPAQAFLHERGADLAVVRRRRAHGGRAGLFQIEPAAAVRELQRGPDPQRHGGEPGELPAGTRTTRTRATSGRATSSAAAARSSATSSARSLLREGLAVQLQRHGYQDFKKCTSGTTTVSCPAAQFPTPTQPRRGTVYVAANDGMLHAFETDVNNSPYYQTGGIGTATTSDDTFSSGNNTGNGAERWAFIPSIVLPDMPQARLHSVQPPLLRGWLAYGGRHLPLDALRGSATGARSWSAG